MPQLLEGCPLQSGLQGASQSRDGDGRSRSVAPSNATSLSDAEIKACAYAEIRAACGSTSSSMKISHSPLARSAPAFLQAPAPVRETGCQCAPGKQSWIRLCTWFRPLSSHTSTSHFTSLASICGISRSRAPRKASRRPQVGMMTEINGSDTSGGKFVGIAFKCRQVCSKRVFPGVFTFLKSPPRRSQTLPQFVMAKQRDDLNSYRFRRTIRP